MMGKKKLSEIKAQLEALSVHPPGKPSKAVAAKGFRAISTKADEPVTRWLLCIFRNQASPFIFDPPIKRCRDLCGGKDSIPLIRPANFNSPGV